MAPRRLIVSEAVASRLAPKLASALRALELVPVTQTARMLLADLVEEATLYGARVLLNGQVNESGGTNAVGVTLVDRGLPSMRIAKTDILAPVLTILYAETAEDALEVHQQCPYALTASVFGPHRDAKAFALRIRTGTVLVNDVIVASADPRASFGGRGLSGFGATRGAEGLLEMTAVKNVLVQTSRSRKAWQPTTAAHIDLFAALLKVLHGRGVVRRLAAVRDLVNAARGLKS
jgi:aldehyde dehydrogenase (NAD+)